MTAVGDCVLPVDVCLDLISARSLSARDLEGLLWFHVPARLGVQAHRATERTKVVNVSQMGHHVAFGVAVLDCTIVVASAATIHCGGGYGDDSGLMVLMFVLF